MSISPESIGGGGITTDHNQQENLEGQQTAELEVQQVISSTSCASFDGDAADTSDDPGKIAEHGGGNESVAVDHLLPSSTELHEKEELHRMEEELKNTNQSLDKKLEQMEGQPMNLPTSSDDLELLTYDVDHLSLSSTELRETKEELNQLKEELTNTKELVGKTLEQVAKLERENKAVSAEFKEYQNKQQQTIDALTQKLKVSINQLSSKEAELTKNKKSDSSVMLKLAHANEIRHNNLLQQEKVVKLEKDQKEQQLNIVALQKTVATFKEIGLIPQNRWDPTACHDKLALPEPNRLVVQHNGKKNGWGSVIAEKPLLLETSYFEVKILEKKGDVFIGLAIKQMPLNTYVGNHEGTVSYDSVGILWGHEVGACSHIDGRPMIAKEIPPFDVGDVVGCGLNLATRQIIYTLNGKRLDTANLFVTFSADLFACVSLRCPGTKIETNFGPDFKYKF